MENRTLSRNWGSETKSPTQTTTQLAHWQTGTRRLSSSPFHSIGMPPSTAREYPFPSGQPRGKEAGNVACFWSSALCVCEYLLISHQWGKLQHLFLFLLAHDTQPVFFGSDSPQSLAAKFFGRMLNVVTQWLPSFQHEQIQIIVFINSCRGDAPTQADSKNGHV